MRDGQVVKGVRFRDHRIVGDILELAMRYRDEGADELVFYDITASPQGRSVDREWVARVARVLDIPFCVAGGIRSVEDAELVLNAGAEKISVNSPALSDPPLDRPAERALRLAVRRGGNRQPQHGRGLSRVSVHGRPESHRRFADAIPTAGSAKCSNAAPGEIVLNCMDSDGTRDGYDIEQLRRVRAICDVPLVASGGAGTPAHFQLAFEEARVDAALAASVFHSGSIEIGDLKRALRRRGLEVRL